MPLKSIYVSNKGGADFKPLEAGVYLAKCYAMVEEGTHTDVYPNAKFPAKPTRGLRVMFEILKDDADEDVRMDNGKPYTMSKAYTHSLDKKASLRKMIDATRVTPLTEEEASRFDVTSLIGQNCLMQVINEARTDGSGMTAKIGNIMSTKKKADGVNEPYVFLIGDPLQEDFDLLPFWLQERVNSSEEMQGRPLRVTTKEERSEIAKEAAPAAQGTHELDEAGTQDVDIDDSNI